MGGRKRGESRAAPGRKAGGGQGFERPVVAGGVVGWRVGGVPAPDVIQGGTRCNRWTLLVASIH